MVYVLLVISLIANVCLLSKIIKFKKLINELYCTDEELDEVIDRL